MDEVDSDSGIVNSQITDAVTQTNSKFSANAPARAIAQIYQAIAHATGLLVENAVNAQQQQSILMMATTTQGVMYLYSQTDAHDGSVASSTAAKGAASDARADVPEPDDLEADVQQSAQQLKQLVSARSSLNTQILDSLDADQHYTLGAAAAFAYAHRVSMDAFVDGLEKVNAAQYRKQLQAIKIAANAVCLDAMLKSPERAKEYAQVFEAIQQLG